MTTRRWFNRTPRTKPPTEPERDFVPVEYAVRRDVTDEYHPEYVVVRRGGFREHWQSCDALDVWEDHGRFRYRSEALSVARTLNEQDAAFLPRVLFPAGQAVTVNVEDLTSEHIGWTDDRGLALLAMGPPARHRLVVLGTASDYGATALEAGWLHGSLTLNPYQPGPGESVANGAPA